MSEGSASPSTAAIARLLVIDCASDAVRVGLRTPQSIALCEAPGGASASETLLPTIDEALRKAHCPLHTLDAIGFGAGPGSFTGVRTAVAVAQALSLAHGMALVPLDLLEALAWTSVAPVETPAWIVPMIDARMGELYVAIYRSDRGAWVCAEPPFVASPDHAVERIASLVPGAWIATGATHLLPTAVAVERRPVVLDARRLLDHGERVAARGRFVDAATAQPLYVRNKVALTTREREAREMVK